MPSEGWDWLERAEAEPAEHADLCRSFARAFAGSGGARVLAWLRATTIERRLPPEASEAALRHLEGQRHIVAAIERMVARGRESPGG